MKFPIGIQTFEKIIEGGYVYVDKTDLVYKLVSSGEYYVFSRPRRFGKSLLTTTLEAYFLGQKELFKGLAIDSLETEWIEYPVFHLDFSGDKYVKENELDSVVNLFLEKCESKYGSNASEVTFGSRFQGVIQRAYEKTGKKVVILIDEYDKPLTDTIGNSEIQDANRSVLQSLYGVFKNADKCIKFTFLTGVTRYGKLGIFSAANNLQDISTSKKYASICGISENELRTCFDDEIKKFAEDDNVSVDEMYGLLKKKYDGYHFSEKSEDIYNPFSLLNALSEKQLRNYWFATGTPTYLVKILKKNEPDLSKLENGILATLENIATFGNGEENIVAALYQSGYLTIKDFNGKFYRLGFPNEEVQDGFIQCLLAEYSGKGGLLDNDLQDLYEKINNDDVEGILLRIKHIIGQIPFENNEPNMMEIHFRNMLYLMIRFTGQNVFVEYPVLGGRIDVFFETNNCVYIIECKRDESAEIALAQIDEKRYAKKISASDKKIVKIGVNFSTKEKNIAEWVVG
ncbi:MAG: ATP-binding protein [Paludibacteraceae bacterium]|nr:ATP-binding protein [Paludibacteraceae bacterium]